MKFINLLLCTSIMFGMVTPVLASETTELQTALTEVKTRLDIGELEDFESSYESDTNGNITYYFYWSENNEDDYESISVAYTDGLIISYDHSFKGEYDNKKSFPNCSYSEALKTAEEFVKKANPDNYQNIKITKRGSSDIYDSSYYFNVERVENSLPVIGNSGNIAVSKATNKIRYFHINYTPDIEFESADDILSVDEGKAAYAEKLAPKLKFSYHYDYKDKELTVFPEYVSAENNRVINAKDGSIYEISEDIALYGYENAKQESAMSADLTAGRGTLSDVELKEISKISGLMSEASIEAKVRENTVFRITSDLKLYRISLNRDYIDDESYVYDLRFRNEDDKNYKYVNVSADAKTGQILSFNKNGVYSEKENQNLENEKKKADAAFKALAADKYSEYRLEENKNTGRVSYIRINDGLEVSGDNASFSFDSEDNIVSYYLNYTKIDEFPSVENVITPEKAVECADDALDFSAAYVIDNEAKKAIPVYCFLDNARIDNFNLNPFTGKLIDYKGEEIENENAEITYSDIENHYGKERFLKLAEFGIGFYGGILEPDKKITQAEFLTVLNDVFGYRTDVEEIYKRYILNGIIKKDEREDNQPVTRETAAILMIREMGAESFAKYDDIYVSPFADVVNNKGYIGLLKAMKVVSGDENGNFNPDNTITRGEALIMVYNYLEENK